MRIGIGHAITHLRQNPGAGGSSLLNGLVAAWKLEEASGTRADASGGGLGLTANNNPGNTAGIIGNGVQLVRASSQYLSRADQALLRPFRGGQGGWTLAGWFYPASLPAVAEVAAKDDFGGQREFSMLYNGSWSLQVLTAASGLAGRVDLAGAAAAASQWSFWCVRWDGANLYSRVNTTTGTAVCTSPNPGSTAPFCLGASSNGGNFWDGALDDWSWWGRYLSDAEVDTLYNAGAGKEYPF